MSALFLGRRKSIDERFPQTLSTAHPPVYRFEKVLRAWLSRAPPGSVHRDFPHLWRTVWRVMKSLENRLFLGTVA